MKLKWGDASGGGGGGAVGGGDAGLPARAGVVDRFPAHECRGIGGALAGRLPAARCHWLAQWQASSGVGEACVIYVWQWALILPRSINPWRNVSVIEGVFGEVVLG